MSSPVPAWKPGSFSASTVSSSAAGGSRTFNFNHLPQGDTSTRVKRVNRGVALKKSMKTPTP
ncbi:hypothetical protein [Nocardia sp. NBC_01327]|uniref:hypothetical protein n=1 Tax=Nocardia sp. NBC_01327 TaxID=2903593 RepID=UPI002E113B62|nr:hypothetical protein OG326_02940 [Nocardia sp. NBC_01327]